MKNQDLGSELAKKGGLGQFQISEEVWKKRWDDVFHGKLRP